jgi:hypothetical protein
VRPSKKEACGTRREGRRQHQRHQVPKTIKGRGITGRMTQPCYADTGTPFITAGGIQAPQAGSLRGKVLCLGPAARLAGQSTYFNPLQQVHSQVHTFLSDVGFDFTVNFGSSSSSPL